MILVLTQAAVCFSGPEPDDRRILINPPSTGHKACLNRRGRDRGDWNLWPCTNAWQLQRAYCRTTCTDLAYGQVETEVAFSCPERPRNAQGRPHFAPG